jgi:hypothetical protein
MRKRSLEPSLSTQTSRSTATQGEPGSTPTGAAAIETAGPMPVSTATE